MEIRTSEGPRLVTEEQKKKLYRKEGQTYTKVRGAYMERAKAREVEREGLVPPGVQLVVYFEVTIISTGETKSITAYSKVNRGARAPEEMFTEAYRYMIYVLIDEGTITGSDGADDIEYQITTMEYNRWTT